jgi:hypothetical protein
MPRPLLIGIAVILAVLAAVVILSPRERHEDDGKVTSVVDTLEDGRIEPKTITVPKVAVDQAAKALTGDVPKSLPLDAEDADHTGQRDETPPDAPKAVVDANRAALERNRRTTQALPTAGASGGVPGCVTSFVRNQSSRRGVRPTIQVLHYTVSPNRPGRSDVNGIVAFFNRSSSQASSHFVIDAEGNCAYIVPIEAKSWTQAGGNPWAVSYEIIATGREPAYLGPKGYAKLRSVTAWVAHRIGSPLRRGAISGCSPSRTGIVQHADGGTCWGGHHDVGPFPFSSILAKVTTPVRQVTRANRVTCGKINAWRKAGRPLGGQWERNTVLRVANLRKRGVACTTRGAVRL